MLAELKRLLGPMPKPVPLRTEVVWEAEEDGLIKRRVVFDSETHMSVPGLMYIPADRPARKRLPAILCCHGHGWRGKDNVMGVRLRNADRIASIEGANYDYGLQMAKHGYVTFAIDSVCWQVAASG